MAQHPDYAVVSERNRYRWVVFILVSCIYLLVFFNRQAPAVLALDLIHAFDLNGTSLGLLSAAFFYPYALIQLPSGAITSALGPRRCLCLFFGLAALGTVCFSFATNFHFALLARILVGVGAGMVLIPVLEIVSVWFKKDEFASMVGLLIGIGGVGVFAGATPLSLLDHVVGWRVSFQVVGAVSLALVASVWLLVRDHPSEKGLSAFKPEPYIKESLGVEGFLKQSCRVFVTPDFWPPTIWAFLAIGVFISFGGLWGGPYLQHVHGLEKVEVGHVIGVLALGMILGGPLLGFLAERLLKSRKRVLVLAGVGLVLLMGRMLVGFNDASYGELCVWFGLLGLTTMAAAPLSLTIIRNVFPDELAGTASGIANFFFLTGGAVLQQGVGWLLDLHGYSVSGDNTDMYSKAFLVYFICAIIALVAACLSRESAAKA